METTPLKNRLVAMLDVPVYDSAEFETDMSGLVRFTLPDGQVVDGVLERVPSLPEFTNGITHTYRFVRD